MFGLSVWSLFCNAVLLFVSCVVLSSWCLVMVERLFLTVPRGCLRFVIVVFPDHTNLSFLPLSDVLYFICVIAVVCRTASDLRLCFAVP